MRVFGDLSPHGHVVISSFARRGPLDYARARSVGLPIGSGEIESGHRPVLQQRLKLAGSGWKETNTEAMPGWRVARAD